MSKYKLPWTHSLFQEAVPFDLLVEYYEDIFEEDPHAAFEALRGEDGEIVIDDSGDDLINKWEAELAQGLEPDLEEGLSAEEKKKLVVEREKKKKIRAAAAGMEFADDFGSLAGAVDHVQREYQSKLVVPGSKEDIAMTRASTARKNARQSQPSMLGEEVKRGR